MGLPELLRHDLLLASFGLRSPADPYRVGVASIAAAAWPTPAAAAPTPGFAAPSSIRADNLWFPSMLKASILVVQELERAGIWS